MEMNLDYKEDIMIVRLSGELDQHYASALRSEIDTQVTHRGIHKIVFDFSNVGFMDSSGIGVIMGRYRLMQSVGGSVCAFGISKRLDRLIEMSGIKRIVNVYADEESATRRDG